MSTTFQALNPDGSILCNSLDDAKRQAYQFAYALKCLCGRASSYGYRICFDDSARRITVTGDNGMTNVYQY